MSILDKKGQNTAEYAILIALVVAAAIAMQTYVKRGVQGRVHDASDRFYDSITTSSDWANITNVSASSNSNRQYEPTKLSSKSTQKTIEDTENFNMTKGGEVTRDIIQRTNQSSGDYQKQDY